MLAHPLFPQIRKGLIPVVVEEGEDLIQLLVFNRFNILSKLLQFHLRLGFTVGMIKDIRHLSNDVSEAMDKTFASLPNAKMACFSSTDKFDGFLRRLQRICHNFL